MTFLAAHLCHQDADDHAQLVQGAEGPSDSGGSYLAHVHGGQARAQAAEDADDQPADDDHLEGFRHEGQAHQTPANDSEDVRDEHGLAPGEERGDKLRIRGRKYDNLQQ